MAMHAMPIITDANNEKIVRRDMITVLPCTVAEKPYSSDRLDDPGTSCAGEPQPATSVAPCVIASLIWINTAPWNHAHQKLARSVRGILTKSEIFNSEVISRRKALSLLASVAAFSLTASSAVSTACEATPRLLAWSGVRSGAQNARSGARSDVTDRSTLDRTVLESPDVDRVAWANTTVFG